MTRYAAHPTLYKGILYRSRLEAKWACYFDQRGWQYTYEPFDLIGYSPDFTVTAYSVDGKAKVDMVNVLVEVKPATKVGQLGPPIARILRAGWKGPWMVVGADPDVCMQGVGKHKSKRRYLGREAPEAWAHASNMTQWKGSSLASLLPPRQTIPKCAHCEAQAHLLHRCKTT